jgi:protein TonB
MPFPKKTRSLTAGMFLSVMVHMAAGAGLYYALVVQQPLAIIAELDLSMIPLVQPVMAAQPDPPPPAPKPQAPPPPKKEEAPLSPKAEKAPPPEPEPLPVETVQESPVEPEPAPSAVTEAATEPAAEAASAPAAVSEAPAAAAPSDSTDRYIPAVQTARQPRWVGNLIGPRDYPKLAKQEGKDGRVLLTVFIDRPRKGRSSFTRKL